MTRSRSRLLALLAAFPLLLGACAQQTPAEELPDGLELLNHSAVTMDGLSSLRFALNVDGSRPSTFQVVDAEGTLTAGGDLEAIAQLLMGGRLVEYSYMVVDGTPYLRGPTGGYRQIPQSMADRIFDPSRLLVGERNLASALREVTEADTEAEERIDGVDTYRITGNLNPRSVEGLALLASGSAQEVTIWVARDSGELVRARMPFTMPGEDDETVVTITLSDFDQPVDIQAPA